MAIAAAPVILREVHCTDALPWLADRTAAEAIITSLPDAAEMGMPLPEWAAWFAVAATACMRATQPGGPCIFYQTDRRAGGQTYSKPYLLLQAADHLGLRLLWHKIVLRRAPGATDLHRPTYSHMLAFSRAGAPGPATPDVIEGGGRVYADGMALMAARVAVAHAARTAGMVTDPFCGRGTVLAVANAAGLPALGVDIDPTQCAAARNLVLPSPLAGF